MVSTNINAGLSLQEERKERGFCSWAGHQPPPSPKTKEPEKFNFLPLIWFIRPAQAIDPLLFFCNIDQFLIGKMQLEYNHQLPKKYHQQHAQTQYLHIHS